MDQHDMARLVMGYLKNECLDAAAIFAASSPHLYEYRVQTFRNKHPITTVYNMTLNNILQEYWAIHTYVKNKLPKTVGFQSSSMYNRNEFNQNFSQIIIRASVTDPSTNEITILNDSRVNNAEAANNENPENEQSEIAQLVLGYLNDECPSAADSFLAKSSKLSNYRLQIFKNKNPSTLLNGMTLVDILQHYCSMLTHIQNVLKGKFGLKIVCSPGNVIKNLKRIILNNGVKPTKKQQPQIKIPKNNNLKSETPRTHLTLTKRQENLLNIAFQDDNYAIGLRRKFLAHETGLTEMQVKQWFQKRRNNENRNRSQTQNTSCPVDSSAIIYKPGPSTYQSFIKNEMSISSSSSNTQPIRSDINGDNGTRKLYN